MTRFFAALFWLLAAPVAAHAADGGSWNADNGIRPSVRTLVDQYGRAVEFPAGLLGREPVVLSFTFLGCETRCPVTELLMSVLDRSDAEVTLVSLTINPLDDTPDKLLERAALHGASSRWIWLTGAPDAVFDVVDSLGMRFGSLESHGSFFLVIAPDGRTIRRLDGDPDPAKLLAAVEAVRHAP